MYGQTRIFFAMCRDGLLPERLAKVNQRYGTPARLTIGLGVLIAILAALVPLSEIVKLVNIGTLFAFVLVNIGVIILRRTRPDMPRPYRVPWSPVLPILGIAVRRLPDDRTCRWTPGSGSWSGWLLGVIIYVAVRLPQLPAAARTPHGAPTTGRDPGRARRRRAE